MQVFNRQLCQRQHGPATLAVPELPFGTVTLITTKTDVYCSGFESPGRPASWRVFQLVNGSWRLVTDRETVRWFDGPRPNSGEIQYSLNF